MDDPKLAGDHDTYGGANWTNPECGEPTLANDYCGVHSNSGVLSKWFCLLTAGSGKAPDDGQNDKGDSHTVNGLGFAKSELIAFGTEIQLSPNATFAGARAAAITYARAVYDPCSAEEEAVTNAWFAVGVGAEFSCESNGIVTGFLTTGTEVSEAAFGPGNCGNHQVVNVKVFVNEATNYDLELGGTATNGVDYEISSLNISYSGNNFATIDVAITIFDDAADEGDETIILSIPTSIGSAPGSDVHTLTIRNDDLPPVVGIGQQSLLYERFLSTSIPTGWVSMRC